MSISIEQEAQKIKRDTFLVIRDSQNSHVLQIISLADLQIGTIDIKDSAKGLILHPKTAPDTVVNKLYNENGTLMFNGEPLVGRSFFSSTTKGSIFTTGSTAFVGGQATPGMPDAPSDVGPDVFFFVSGTAGSKDTTITGSAVFGGDVVISGALHGGSPLQIGEYLTTLGTDVAFYVSGAKDSKNTSVQGASLFGGDVIVSGTLYAEKYVVEVDETVTGSLLVSGTLVVSQSGLFYEGLVVNESGECGTENDFRVESNNFTHAIFVDSCADQVLILSGGANEDSDFNIDEYTDTNFFVSGAIDSKDSSVKGTSVFGGDLVVSGSILPGADNATDLGSATNRFANVYTGDLHLRNDKGDWTIVEERDALIAVNNITGKKYEMMLKPLD